MSFGQRVIVDNRSGPFSIGIVAKASPDGYTLLLYSGAMWLLPLMRDDVPWDPVKDISNITVATASPNILVVHPSLPAKSVKELIALAKAKPGELNYATGSKGSPPHLAAELFQTMTGINMVQINYKGASLSMNALIANEVQLSFPNAAAVPVHVKSGRLRALAVTSAQPSALVPGLPTVAAAGLPGFEVTTIQGIFAPSKTPAALINQLNQEIVRVLNTAEARKRFLDAGVEAVGSSSAQLTERMEYEIAKWGKVIKDLGIRAD